jgi:VWFA-related protein
MRSTFLETTTALILLACATASAEDSTPSVRAEVVRLDVVVTNAQGTPVRDLVREDFAVFEDGKPQRLTDVVFVGGPGAVALATAAGPATSEDEQEPRRPVAIVVDELHLSQRGVGAVKETLRRFLADTVAPDDEIALVLVGSPAATVKPTRDRAALRQGIERIRARGDSITTGQGAQLTPEQAEQILRGDPSALRLAARLAMDEPGSLFSGRFIPKNGSSDPVPAGVEPGEKAAAIDAEKQARRILAEALSISEISLGTLERVLRALAPFPGRKLCLFVSDGFLVGRGTSEEQTSRLQQVIDAGTRSGTAVYPLLAGALAPIGGDAAAVGGAGPAGLRDRVARMAEQQRMETLQGLADDTGGLVVRGTDAIGVGLARMLEDGESVYLLGYEPTNQKRNGRFRRLVVRVLRHRDYVVRTRKGYFAPDAKKLAKQATQAGR